MALLVASSLSDAGVNLEASMAAAAAGGDEFSNSGRQLLYVKNDGISPINVTIGAVEDKVIAVPNGEKRMIGPFPPRTYNAPSGRAKVTYSAVTSLSVKVFSF